MGTTRVKTARRYMTLLLPVALALAACGGGGGEALSDEEFCDLAASLDAQSTDFADDADAIRAIEELASKAPNGDMRRALAKTAEFARDLSELDEDDPEAIGEAFTMMFDPQLMAAAETLNTYFSEVCGFEESFMETGDVSGGDDFEFDFEDEGDTDDSDTDDESSGVVSDGSAWDDLDSSELREALEPAVERYASPNAGTGMGIYSDGSGVTVELSVDGTDGADPYALCISLADAVDERTDDPGVTLSVMLDGERLAERSPGGECTEL